MKIHYLWLALLLSGSALAANNDEPVVLVDDGVGTPCTPSVTGEVHDGTVYGGPGVAYRQKGKIGKDQVLFVCEKRSGWVSVVYDTKSPARPADDCQLGAYAMGASVYKGTCNTGWIKTAPLKTLLN